MSTFKNNNSQDDHFRLTSLAKTLTSKTYDSYLEKKGYKLLNTIGTGSYAKVKLVS